MKVPFEVKGPSRGGDAVRSTAKQVGLYLVVGGFNTLFGVLIYWTFVWLLDGVGRYGYMIAAVLSNVVAVTVAFLSYKLFVFRTRGNWCREYLKCWVVYGGAAVLNLLLLPFCVEVTRMLLPDPYKPHAPYLGGLLLTGVTVVLSFLGHRNFTFKK